MRPVAARGQPAESAPRQSSFVPPHRVETGLTSQPEPSLPQKVLALHRKLVAGKAPHAFGGALALAYYAEPRATIDVDLNVFLAPAHYERVASVLAQLGVSDGPAAATVERDGQCRLSWGRTPIDLFFAYDALHEAMRGAIRTQPFADATIPILAPQHLLVCKAIFNRPKDWLDIEQITLTVEDLDAAEILGWLDRILAADDPRRRRVTKMLA